MSSNEMDVLLDAPLNSKHYDSQQDSSYKPKNDNYLECDQQRYTACGIRVTPLQLSILLSFVAAICSVSLFIVWPVYLTDLDQSGGDLFTATVVFSIPTLLVFIVVMVIRWYYTREIPLLHPNGRYVKAALYGLGVMLHDTLMTFGSLPTRTMPQLLGILAAAVLPNTIICRYVILRKGVGIKQLMCAFCVLFGVFVSLIPEIFSFAILEGTEYQYVNISHDRDTLNNSRPNRANIDDVVVYGWAWPLVIVGSTLPFAISIVILEQEIKSPEVSFATFVFWAEVFRCLSLVTLCWLNLIPNLGMETDFAEFMISLGRGLYCSFSSDPSCKGCLASGMTFTLLAPCGSISIILLTKYAEGAIYTMLIKSSSKPISTLFWTLFVDAGSLGLLWRPKFNINTIMAFVGLLLIVPATCLYAYLSNRVEKSTMIELKQIQ